MRIMLITALYLCTKSMDLNFVDRLKDVWFAEKFFNS